jgi:hypothetical protein
MPEDRRAAYRAYDRTCRHELEIVTRLLEEILPGMPKPRGWSHQPHVGRRRKSVGCTLGRGTEVRARFSCLR